MDNIPKTTLHYINPSKLITQYITVTRTVINHPYEHFEVSRFCS